MAYSNKYQIWVCAVCLILLGGCTKAPQIKNEIVHIEGVIWACNVTTSYSLFGSFSESDEKAEVYLPSSDGDLLYMLCEGDQELYFRYSALRAGHMRVEHDTVETSQVFVDGDLAQVEISDNTDFEKLATLLENSGSGILATLVIRDTLTDDMIGELDRIGDNLGPTGLYLTADISAGQLRRLTLLCEPDWIAIESFPADPESGKSYIPEQPELLWLSGNFSLQPEEMERLGRLESLIIAEWEPKEEESINLSGLKNLQTLTLAECSLTKLSQLEFPDDLQRLHLLDCDTLSDIFDLSKAPRLQSLGLSGSDQVGSLAPIQGLTGLTRLAFPGNISQKDFASLVSQLPILEEVELLDCSEVTDLTPLQNKESLRILAIQVDSIWPEGLDSLDQLELVILTQDEFENNPDLVARLRAQLPGARVVPGGGLCMGSGWLLLLIPMIIVARLLFKRNNTEIPVR